MTDSVALTALFALSAYLLGSIPTAVLVCRALDIPDPRTKGSGNPGTTNVLRIGSRKAALITLLGDSSKGLLALLPGILLELPLLTQSLCCILVICGHLWPVFNGFRGGKGVATALGACAGLFWPLALVQLCCWVAIVAIGRISSLASIGTALISPLFVWIAADQLFPVIMISSLLLLFSHHQNIRNMLNGREPRL